MAQYVPEKDMLTVTLTVAAALVLYIKKKKGKSLTEAHLVTNLSSTKRPCMHSFLMLSGWYNESGHKS